MVKCECGNDCDIAYLKKDGSPYFRKVCSSCRYLKRKEEDPEKMKIDARKVRAKRDNNPNKRIQFLINESIKRNKTWSLSIDEAMQFWNKSCFYCGDAVNGLHLDRIDSKKGYIFNNVVSACGICNIMKYTFSQDEFLNKIKQIYKNRMV
jgi:hypothetical protein